MANFIPTIGLEIHPSTTSASWRMATQDKRKTNYYYGIEI